MTDNETTIHILRIVDANANRASEALRTIEEHARFVLNDKYLSQSAKEMRHRLTTAVAAAAMIDRVRARDRVADVGRELTTQQELQRENVGSVVAAAFGRLQQALRCLEEYSKPILPTTAPLLEQLRYEGYDLQKGFLTVEDSVKRLQTARLYAIMDGQGNEAEFTNHVTQLEQAGVDAIQLRDKELDDGPLLQRAQLLRKILNQGAGRTLLIINDRPDIAVLSGADGVHLGQREMSVQQARRIVGTEALIGISTHSIAQVQRAIMDGANYIGCGPVFQSQTKSFNSFPGLDFLEQVAAESALPAFAIGGIDPDNVSQVVTTGFTRIAVKGCLSRIDTVDQVVRVLRNALVIPDKGVG